MTKCLTRRKFLKLSVAGLALTAGLAACEQGIQSNSATPAPAATPTVPPDPSAVPPVPSPLPSPQGSARAFLTAWELGKYEAMYGLISEESKAVVSQEAFVKRYRDIASEGAFRAIRADPYLVYG